MNSSKNHLILDYENLSLKNKLKLMIGEKTDNILFIQIIKTFHQAEKSLKIITNKDEIKIMSRVGKNSQNHKRLGSLFKSK